LDETRPRANLSFQNATKRLPASNPRLRGEEPAPNSVNVFDGYVSVTCGQMDTQKLTGKLPKRLVANAPHAYTFMSRIEFLLYS
jgi:hypothetical protein